MNVTTPADAAPRLSWKQALAWRMRRHHLIDRAQPEDLVRVAGDIGGLHAQLMSSAELSALARIDGLSRDAVQDALWKDRSLVKLWAMRGTLYLLPSRELGMWLSGFGTYTKFGNAGRDDIDELARAVGEALEGHIFTREELAVEVERITGSETYGEWVRHSWGSYLKAASFRGLICFAPGDGANVRFTSPESWVPGGIERVAPEDAFREITRRYLSAYAPVTVEEIARWWGGPPVRKQGMTLLAALGDEAVEVDIEGTHAWALARDLEKIACADAPDTACLLPAFDPWIFSTLRQAPLIDARHVERVFRKQAWISPVLLVNGWIAGVWKHQRKGRRLLVEIEPFGRLPVRARNQVEAEAERMATFFECELDRVQYS